MSVSKRLRYEVLRRDGNTCRYCGGTAPNVELTVDHVLPVALGGADEASNLVAACRQCNAGKSASSPDAPLVADVATDAMRWAQAQQIAAQQMLDQVNRRDALYAEFTDVWDSWRKGYRNQPCPLPEDWESSIASLLSAGLPMAVLLDCVDIAMKTPNVYANNRFRYMCGVAWKKVGKLQDATRRVLDGSPTTAPIEQELPADDLLYEAWGLLPFTVDDEHVKTWARKFRNDRAWDDEPEFDFTQWPDDACGFLRILEHLSSEHHSMFSTIRDVFKRLPVDLVDECRREGARVCEEQGEDPSMFRTEIDRYAMRLALDKLLPLADDERPEQNQMIRAEVGDEH